MTHENYKKIMMFAFFSFLTISLISSGNVFPAHASESIDMKKVRSLAKLSVDEILETSPVELFSLDNYWSSVKGRNKPLVVIFYTNSDASSQRLATLIKYIASDLF